VGTVASRSLWQLTGHPSHPIPDANFYVVSLSRGLGHVPPVMETLWADSQAVNCRPDDGRLTTEGWVVVVKE